MALRLNKNFVLIVSCLFIWHCAEEEQPLPQDCAGIEGGSNVCGCTDNTAPNTNTTLANLMVTRDGVNAAEFGITAGTLEPSKVVDSNYY